MGFVDDEDRMLFSCRDFRQECLEGFGEKGDREGSRLDLKGKQDVLEEFEDGAGVGRNGNHPVLGGMKGSGGIPEGGGFTRSHLSGDDTDGTQFKSIEKSVCQSFEAGQKIKVLDLDILREGFSLKAEEVLIANHRPASFQRVFHPGRILPWMGRLEKSVAVRCRCAPRFV